MFRQILCKGPRLYSCLVGHTHLDDPSKFLWLDLDIFGGSYVSLVVVILCYRDFPKMEQNQLMLFIPSYSLAVLLGVVYIYPIHESPGRPQQFVVNLRRPSSLPWMEIRRKQRSPWAIFLVLTEKCRLDGMRRNQEIRNNWCFSHRFIVVFFFPHLGTESEMFFKWRPRDRNSNVGFSEPKSGANNAGDDWRNSLIHNLCRQLPLHL